MTVGADQLGVAVTLPNIIVVMVDDMRVDDLAAMPQAKKLVGAADGLGATYTNSYASYPLCVPSRSSFLSGQYAHNHGVIGNTEPDGGWQAFDDSDTLPMWLQRVGYQTVMIGKYLNQYGQTQLGNDPTYIPPGWDSWAALVGNWLNYHAFDINMNGTVRHVTRAYSTSNFTGRAKIQLNNRLPSGQPLFMWLSFVAPHTDGSNVRVPVAPKHEGESTVGAPDSAAFNEADVDDKPRWIKNRSLLTQAEIDKVIRLRRERRDAMRSVDDSVAQIVATLRQHGELANTVLIFMSDNGYMLGEHRIRSGKRYPYEESAAVPLLVRGPGLPTGQIPRMVVNVDVTATICDISGASPAGHQLDGLSLLAPLPAGRKRAILLENTADGGNPPPFAGVRAGNWLFVDYDVTRELYDLATDLDQTTNRAGDPDLADVQQSLAATLAKLRHCNGRSCTITWTDPT